MKTELEKMEILRLSNAESNKITKECLQIALMKLMAEKQFEKISIPEITPWERHDMENQPMKKMKVRLYETDFVFISCFYGW